MVFGSEVQINCWS